MNLTVTVSGEAHAIPLATGALGWSEAWSPSATLPDVWAATRPLGSGFIVEVEVSNASADVGKKGRPVVDGVQVSVTPPAGFEILDPWALPWPTLWPLQRGTFRRYGIVPVGIPQTDSRRINEYVLGTLRSSWMLDAEQFGPAGLPLPTLTSFQSSAMATRDMDNFYKLLDAVQRDKLWHMEDWEDGKVLPAFRGGWPIYGAADQAAPGGSGIQFARGYQKSLGFARLALLCSILCENGGWVQYRRTGGAPMSVDDYTGLSPDYKPGTTASNGRLPEFTGVPNDDPIRQEFDPAHQIRQVGYWIAAYEMTGSPAVRRLLLCQGEEQRMIYSERTTVSMGGGYFSQNLATWERWFADAPGRVGKGYPGSLFGRQVGWSAWVIAEAIKLDPTRQGLVGWGKRMLEVAKQAAMPSGICQRMSQVPLWNDATHDSAQSFEVAIWWYGMYALAVRTGTM